MDGRYRMDTAGKLDTLQNGSPKTNARTEMTTKWLVMAVHKIATLKFMKYIPFKMDVVSIKSILF